MVTDIVIYLFRLQVAKQLYKGCQYVSLPFQCDRLGISDKSEKLDDSGTYCFVTPQPADQNQTHGSTKVCHR